MHQALKIPDAKAALENGKTGENPGMAADESQKQEVIEEARNKLKRAFFVINGLVILEHQFQKYKGRVVLRRDIVKDDSGSYAVFTESSASQMTAASVMGKISILPGCAGQAADAEYLLNPGPKGKCSITVENSSWNVQIFGYVYQNTNDQNHGPV